MDYITTALENGNWDTLADPLKVVKSVIDVDEEDNVKLKFFVVPDCVINKFDMSLVNLVCYPHVKACLFETPFTENITVNPDVIVGFIPHPDATDIVNVNVRLEPTKRHFFSRFIRNYQCVEWHCQIQPKKYKHYTPFLYGTFPFPKISYANWKVKITCKSHLKPLILCANVQSKERKQLVTSNIYTPFNDLLFPKLNKYVDRKAADIVLQHI
jgi:hypothetical protein